MLSVSGAVLPLVFGYPELAPIAGLLSASVGVTKETEEFYYLDATIDIKNQYERCAFIDGYYYCLPVKFDYDGDSYYIGTLYIDAEVSCRSYIGPFTGGEDHR
ncbi:hypothetical protein PABY_05740 [Pyrodictium abyssi]|uniref:Uncharacterized protein n=1 Tax=Pyrodictium abyssi TaxID=54256 RepID=A0ABN6ZSM7_9CREN|nr:hypothetical protein PABY_05740 [Pyrodictium abyssi]